MEQKLKFLTNYQQLKNIFYVYMKKKLVTTKRLKKEKKTHFLLTGNRFGCTNFIKYPFKFFPLQLDYGEDEEKVILKKKSKFFDKKFSFLENEVERGWQKIKIRKMSSRIHQNNL